MHILVTGANGFVGTALCDELVRAGHRVRAALRRPGTSQPGCEPRVLGTMDGQTAWNEALQGVEVVIHLAARVHVMHDTVADPAAEFHRFNVDATLNLARQAIVAGVRRMVFLSSVKACGESSEPGRPLRESDSPAPRDDYGRSKLAAEEGLLALARETGLEVVIVRPPLVYGPGVKANFAALMRLVARGWPLPLGRIRNRRSLVGLRNLVDFIGACATHPRAPGNVFFVSDGQDLSTTELVRAMAQAAHVPARLLPVPARWLAWLGRCTGREAAIQRLCGDLQVDIEKARRVLDWQPPVSIQDELRRASQHPADTHEATR